MSRGPYTDTLSPHRSPLFFFSALLPAWKKWSGRWHGPEWREGHSLLTLARRRVLLTVRIGTIRLEIPRIFAVFQKPTFVDCRLPYRLRRVIPEMRRLRIGIYVPEECIDFLSVSFLGRNSFTISRAAASKMSERCCCVCVIVSYAR